MFTDNPLETPFVYVAIPCVLAGMCVNFVTLFIQRRSQELHKIPHHGDTKNTTYLKMQFGFICGWSEFIFKLYKNSVL